MANLIQKTDTLNAGRIKLNAAITDAETAKVDAGKAVDTSGRAEQIAQTAEDKADNVQSQFNQVIIEGDSSVEAAQARVDEKGGTHPTLKARIDDGFTNVTSQLADIVVNVNSFDSIHEALLKASEVDGSTLFFPRGKHEFNETLHIPFNINIHMEGDLVYTGQYDNKPFLVIGDPSNRAYRRTYKISVIRNVLSNWGNDDSIGVKMYNAYESDIDLSSSNFTTGIQLIGAGAGFVYNKITLRRIFDNKYGLVLTNENGGWFNENLFLNGRFHCASSTHPNLSRYGVRLTSTDGMYTNNNANKFIKPSFEIKKPTSGEALPILIEHGSLNRFESCRNEGNSGTLARLVNRSTNNFFSVSFGNSNIDDQSDYPSSFSKAQTDVSFDKITSLVFSTGDLGKESIINEVNHVLTPKVFYCNSGTNAIYRSVTNVSLSEKGVIIPTTRGIGIRVDTSIQKRFIVDQKVSSPGRINIRCFDINGNILKDGKNYVKGRASRPPYYADIFGGAYRTGSDDDRAFYFELHEDVKEIDIIQSGCVLSSFSIYSEAHTTVYNPLQETPTQSIVEKGSNENGEYVKLGDGTQLCYATVTVNLNTNEYQDFLLPSEFPSDTHIGISLGWANAPSGSTRKAVRNALVTLGGDNDRWRLWLDPDNLTDGELSAHLSAIGKWR